MCCLYLGTKQLLSSLPVPYLSQNYPQINHREIKERSYCIPLSLDLLPNMTGGKKKKSQNVLIWKGLTWIIESSSWLCTGQPQKSHPKQWKFIISTQNLSLAALCMSVIPDCHPFHLLLYVLFSGPKLFHILSTKSIFCHKF